MARYSLFVLKVPLNTSQPITDKERVFDTARYIPVPGPQPPNFLEPVRYALPTCYNTRQPHVGWRSNDERTSFVRSTLSQL